jgi:putative oxidoreductase
MKSTLISISRVMLALYFFLPGVSKFIFWDMHVALMETHNMTWYRFFLQLLGLLKLLEVSFLLLNKWVVAWALTFAAMIILINLNLHDFWNIYEGCRCKT